MNIDIGLASHLVGASGFLLLLARQIKSWDAEKSSVSLLVAISMTILWCVSIAFQNQLGATTFYLIPTLEILKNVAWYCLLLSMLGVRNIPRDRRSYKENLGLLGVTAGAVGIPLLLIVVLWFKVYLQRSANQPVPFDGSLLLSSFLLMAIVGLALLEQVIRNARYDHTWHIKFLCLGLGTLFCFDLYMYSDAILLGQVNTTFWDFRGAVVAFSALLIGVSIYRTSNQALQVNISRRLVFHTGILLVSGIYLLLMSGAGYYIRNFSGEWGFVLQIFFWLISLSLLLVLIFSGRFRGYLKFYISRNLFSTKYDYREEWLRISNTLSQTASEETLPERALRAIAEVVDSQGGGLWITWNHKHYDQVAQSEMGWITHEALTLSHPLIHFLETRNWIIEVDGKGEADQEIALPQWMRDIKKIWLIIPLRLNEQLLGFIVLKEAKIETVLSWEDLDLLKAAAQQAASYLGQMIVTEALSDARQFSAFNQMSAFVVHDIKTLNSQLSLMVGNAARHKNNPSFIEDMIKTTDHAVQKLNFLLQHFKQSGGKENTDDREGTDEAPLDLVKLVEQVIDLKQNLSPKPEFVPPAGQIMVSARHRELLSAISHVVQNAQEATPNDGHVRVTLNRTASNAHLEVSDTGSGMSQEFIKTRLFRPFESTKGVTGMGIGVYQSREIIRSLGGDLTVESHPGEGSTFVFTLPLYQDQFEQAGQIGQTGIAQA